MITDTDFQSAFCLNCLGGYQGQGLSTVERLFDGLPLLSMLEKGNILSSSVLIGCRDRNVIDIDVN